MSFYVPQPNYKKIYGPEDFGKSPLLLGFRRRYELNQKGGTEISISDILKPSKIGYISKDKDMMRTEELGRPTYWRANRKSLKLYSEKDEPLNTRIDRRSVKTIPIGLLRDINEDTETIIIKKGLFRQEKTVKKDRWEFSKETQSRKILIERPSYYFDFDVYGKADVYWFT